MNADLDRLLSEHAARDWTPGDDPLSSVLLDLRLSGTFFSFTEWDHPWAVEIPPRDFASFHFVARGDCCIWTKMGGRPSEPVTLATGDLVLLPRSPRRLVTSAGWRPGTVHQGARTGVSCSASEIQRGSRCVSLGDANNQAGDGTWLIVCGAARFEGFVAAALLDLLPDVLTLHTQSADPVVATALQAMQQESRQPSPGSATLITRLADVVMIHAIRAWIASVEPSTGWLAALKDPQVGRAIASVHQRPEGDWCVDTMAGIACLSRSRFSERFAALVGQSPMHYVTGVRMHRARELMRSENVGIAAIADRFGYRSEFAFARAFKRHVGIPPGAARRRMTSEQPLRPVQARVLS